MFEHKSKFQLHSRINTGSSRLDLDRKIHDATIEVLFKSSRFFPLVLQQQLTLVDFISYCGGSLGLFLGFSALSLFEIVYYFTLRIVCLKKQQAKLSPSSHTKDSTKTSNHPISDPINEFVENSSIHGCNQIVMAKRHWIERFLWMVLVSTAVVFCGTTTYSFLMKFIDTPIILKYEDSLDTSQEITFPAITFNNEHTSRFLRTESLLVYFGFSYEWIMWNYGEE
jgi:hypothetical protein